MAPRLVTCVAPFLLLAHAAIVATPDSGNDRTITQVVTLLQSMMKQSKQDGDIERDLYAKYKCYKDTNEAQKNAEIVNLEKQIGLLENKIEELLASTAALSKKLAVLLRKMAANKKAREEANTLRGQESGVFMLLSADLDKAMKAMRDAIKELSEVGADQTFSESGQQSAMGHSQYMAGYTGASLASLDSVVRKALVAASALAGSKQTTIEAFLQAAPGTYSAQSGEVVGILKDMYATFRANLAAASAVEMKAEKAHDKFIAHMKKAYEEMNGEREVIKKKLSSNDDTLSSKKVELQTAQDDLSNAQTFLSTLLDLYDAKTKQYNKRVELRTTEESALAEAIAILNSDSAFASFGKVAATRTGATSFVQYQSIRKHTGLAPAMGGSRRKAQAFLQRVADSQHSPMLGRIVALLQAQNPFKVVLSEIDKMLLLIGEEEKADDDQQLWCNQERSATDQSIGQKDIDLGVLTAAIHTLQQDINDPVTGLLKRQSDTETSIDENHNSQVSTTEQRREDNAAYQTDIANLVDATALLKRAIVVLRKYYSQISSEISSSLMQKSPTEPETPATWDDKYSGQSTNGKSAVDQLEFVLQNTQSEEKAAHDAEVLAQHSFEDEMTTLTGAMASLQTSLGQLREQLASKQKNLITKQKEHKATTKEKAALENYLAKIRPGCNFISTNLDTRKANRLKESQALTNAKTLLEGSPAYTEAAAQAHQESLGDCAPLCNRLGESRAECKACLAKVSTPGYCAGHPDTAGCADLIGV